jgi:hypothetical protein
MSRITNLLLGSALTTLLAACSGAEPTSPGATDRPDAAPVVAAQAGTPSSACTVSTTPEFTVTLTWANLPVQRIVLWHSLGDRSSTQTLSHQAKKGTLTVLLGFEPVLAVFYDRAGSEVARQNC